MVNNVVAVDFPGVSLRLSCKSTSIFLLIRLGLVAINFDTSLQLSTVLTLDWFTALVSSSNKPSYTHVQYCNNLLWIVCVLVFRRVAFTDCIWHLIRET